MLKIFSYVITFASGMAFIAACLQPWHWLTFAICVIMAALCYENRDGIELERGEGDRNAPSDDEPIDITFDE